MFRSVPVQVWYSNVMYEQLDCWKKPCIILKNVSHGIFVCSYSTYRSKTDMYTALVLKKIRPWISSRVMRRGAK